MQGPTFLFVSKASQRQIWMTQKMCVWNESHVLRMYVCLQVVVIEKPTPGNSFPVQGPKSGEKFSHILMLFNAGETHQKQRFNETTDTCIS